MWQLNEPWPNAHNTSVLEYDLAPKLAYYRCREANAPVALHWGMAAPVAAKVLRLEPGVLSDTAGRGRILLEAFDLYGTRLWMHTAAVHWPATAEPVDFELPRQPTLLRGRVYSEDGAALAFSEIWVARDRPRPFLALATLPPTQISANLNGSRLTLTNTGKVAAPWLSLEAAEDGVEFFDDNGFTLLPAEVRELSVHLQGLDGQPRRFTLKVQAVNVEPLSVNVKP